MHRHHKMAQERCYARYYGGGQRRQRTPEMALGGTVA